MKDAIDRPWNIRKVDSYTFLMKISFESATYYKSCEYYTQLYVSYVGVFNQLRCEKFFLIQVPASMYNLDIRLALSVGDTHHFWKY